MYEYLYAMLLEHSMHSCMVSAKTPLYKSRHKNRRIQRRYTQNGIERRRTINHQILPVQKTRVYDEIVKGIPSQASRCLHTLHEFHRGLEITNTATLQRRPHMWRHAPEYFEIVAAIPQRFTGSFGQDTNATDILVGHGARVNTRVANNLQHSRNGYPGVALEVYLHPRQHD